MFATFIFIKARYSMTVENGYEQSDVYQNSVISISYISETLFNVCRLSYLK